MPATKTTLRRGLAVAVTASVFFAAARDAHAVGEPKAGPLMGNLKIGPAIRLDDMPTQFALQAEIAYAVDKNDAAYLGFNPQFQFADGWTTINLTATFQYDIELPPDGLYLYPKLNAGLAIYALGGRDPGLAFALQPEFGIKYNIVKNFHIGFEPLSIPLYLGGNRYDAGFDAQYRLFFYGGFDV